MLINFTNNLTGAICRFFQSLLCSFIAVLILCSNVHAEVHPGALASTSNKITNKGRHASKTAIKETAVIDCAVTGTATTTVACTGSSYGTATVTLSGAGSGAPGTYTINGGSSQAFSSNPFTITGLGAGNYIIVATVTASGCISADISITISSSLPPIINASASSSVICAGTSTTLTATGGSTYTWIPGSLSGATVSVSPGTTTTYTVTGTSAAGCVGGNIWAGISGGGSHSLGIKTDGTLWAWGLNTYGEVGDGTTIQRNSPVQIGTATNWISISAGNVHSLGIRSDGTLWGWGYNVNGQVGDASTINRLSPVQIGSATDWTSISAGSSHSLGIRNGTVWAWGYNANGQIGDGTGIQRISPVQVGTATNWLRISAGAEHSMATKTDGTLWVWGRNSFGQVGDGTTISPSIPVQIGTGTNWNKISAGYYHSLATKNDGTLWCWGYNLYGQVGDGSTTQRNSPVQAGIATDWAGIDGGLNHSVGIKTNGTVWGWGYNVYGQLGDGTTVQRNSPVQTGTATNWETLSAGYYHTLGTRTGGSLWAWGYNINGQLGDGTTSTKISPLQIGTTLVSVSVTVNALPVVNFSGLATAYCLTAPAVSLMGSPAGGSFSGPGISGNTFSPATAGTGTHSITYSYTDINGCSNTITKSVNVAFSNALDYVNLQYPGTASFCQGGSLTVYGQLYEPGLTEAAGAGAGVTAEIGYSSTNSNPATWINWQPATFNVQYGNNDEYSSTLTLPAGTWYYTFRYTYVSNTCGYQYGGYSAEGGNAWNGSTYVSGVLTINPLPTITIAASATTICTGTSATLTASGASTYVWMPGSLTGTSISVSPTTATTYTVTGASAAGCAGGNIWSGYSAGAYHNIGIKTNGTLWGSGENLYGELGDGTVVSKTSPVQVGSATNWFMVSAGNYHSLAIKTNGTLWAWGNNSVGQLGDGTTVDKSSPVQIGTATNWTTVSAGAGYSLGLKSDGTLWAWGSNAYGQLGDGTGTQRTSPVQVGTGTSWATVSAGGYHNLAIKTDGTLWVWGRNTFGQLGDGTTVDKINPVQLGSGSNWKTVSACFFHSIALKTDGTLWTCGYNINGQVGDGTTTNKLSLSQIGSATDWSSVDGGLYHSLGIKKNGTLWVWGANNYGQLGDGTMIQRNSPVQAGLSTNWASIEAGSYHTVGIKRDGGLWVFGRNMEGQLGNGSTSLAVFNPEQVGPSSVSVTISVNPLPVVSFSGLAANYCINSAAATLTGSPAGGIFSGPGVSGNTFDPATSGGAGVKAITYSYTNNNGCTNTSTQNVNVNEIAGGTVSFSGLAGPYCTTIPAITLTGTPSGGTFNGSGIHDNGNSTATFSPSAAGVGTHSITYAYSNGVCSSNATLSATVLPNYTITASAGPNGNISPAGVTSVCSGNGQLYTITAHSGYHIANVFVDGSPVGAVASYPFAGVTAMHTISASFAVDCTLPVLSTEIANVTCNGQTNGAIDLTLTGGSSPFIFSWTGPGGFTASSEDIAGLAPGDYEITITASGNCTLNNIYTITQPEIMELSCSGTSVTCNGYNNGTALVNVSGGTGPFTYSWTNGGGITGSAMLNPLKDNTIYAESITNSNAIGQFIAIGNDDGGSIHRGLMAFDIWGNLPRGAIITSAALTLHVSRVGPGSGIQPIYLHHLFSNWGEGTSFTSQTGIGAPATQDDPTWKYSFYASVTWNSNGGDFDPISSAVTDVDAPNFYTWSSPGMIMDAQAWLDNPTNNFGWLIKSNETGTFTGKRIDSKENASPSNQPVLSLDYVVPDIIGTGSDLSDLPPGSYTVTVTDANGCSSSCTYTVIEPDPIVVTATPGAITCNGGTTSVTVTATGGSLNYTSGTGIITGVTAGESTFTVTDTNGCSGSTTITLNEPPAITVSFSGLSGPYCTGDAAVTLTGSPAGGTFSGPGISGNSFSPLVAGTGTHTIVYNYTNGSGCVSTSSQQATVNVCGASITVNLKLFLQGYYIGGGTMQPVLTNQGIAALPTETDSVIIELHDPETYELVNAKTTALSIIGSIEVTYDQAPGSYYIAVKHRNSVQTWSADPVSCTSSTPLYDFTTAASKAYGDNMIEVEPGVWAFYVGDLNQDEFIDAFDYSGYNDDNLAGVNGIYIATDMNGDGFVDAFDYSMYNDNNLSGVQSIHP